MVYLTGLYLSIFQNYSTKYQYQGLPKLKIKKKKKKTAQGG